LLTVAESWLPTAISTVKFAVPRTICFQRQRAAQERRPTLSRLTILTGLMARVVGVDGAVGDQTATCETLTHDYND
jgi:hypothetical protein